MFASSTFLFSFKEVIIHLLVYLVSDSLALGHSMNAIQCCTYNNISYLVVLIKISHDICFVEEEIYFYIDTVLLFKFGCFVLFLIIV